MRKTATNPRTRCAGDSPRSGMSTVESASGLEIAGARQDRDDEVLTPRALELIALLHRELNPRRLELLEARRQRVQALAEGGTLDFLPETAHIRDDDSWQVADPAPGLVDRRGGGNRPPHPPKRNNAPHTPAQGG